MDEKINPSQSKHLLLFSTLAIIALLVMSALMIFFYQRASAAENVTGSIIDMTRLKSFRADISLLKGEATMFADFHSNLKEFSRTNITVYRVDPKKKGVLKSEVIFNASDLYASVSYSHMKELIRTIEKAYLPQLQKLKTYSLLQPVLYNKSSVHTQIAPYIRSATGPENQRTIEELYSMFNKSLIVRPSTWRVSRSRIGPTRYVVGFNKTRLLAFIDRLIAVDKHFNYDVIKQIISSSDGWEKDIIIISLDSQGNVQEVTAYLPVIPKTTLDHTLPSALSFPVLSNIKEKTYSYFYNRKSKNMPEFLRIKIHNNNGASSIKPPTKSIELQTIMETFQQDMTATDSATPSALPSKKPLKKSEESPFIKLSATPTVSAGPSGTLKTPGKGPKDIK